MKKYQKKLKGLFMALWLLASTMTPAFASTYTQATQLDSDTVNKIETALVLLEAEKTLCGMENVDFSTLVLGREIPAYEVTATGISHLSEVSYYPILEDGRWVSTVAVTSAPNGESSVTISQDFIDAYNSNSNPDVNASHEIAILFDNCNSFLSLDSVLISVATFESVLHRISVENVSASINLESSEICAAQALSLQPSNVQTMSTSTYPQVDTLGVPQITQGSDTDECWAACLSSILSYYGTPVSVSTIFSLGNNEMQSAATSAQILKNNYGINYGMLGYYNSYYSASTLTIDNVKQDISVSRAPIFASVQISSGLGHALLIQGYVCLSASSSSVSYLDPLSGTYKQSSLNSSGGFTYVNPSGVSLTFGGGFAAYG